MDGDTVKEISSDYVVAYVLSDLRNEVISDDNHFLVTKNSGEVMLVTNQKDLPNECEQIVLINAVRQYVSIKWGTNDTDSKYIARGTADIRLSNIGRLYQKGFAYSDSVTFEDVRKFINGYITDAFNDFTEESFDSWFEDKMDDLIAYGIIVENIKVEFKEPRRMEA